MHAWRGKAAGLLPTSLLRAVANLRHGARTRRPLQGMTVRSLRAMNVAVIRGKLVNWVPTTTTFNGTGEAMMLTGARIADAGAIRAVLEQAGLQVEIGRPAPGAGQCWRVGAQVTGLPEVDRAHAAVVIIPGDTATPSLPDALEPTFGIDLVYTWVDGGDLRWRADRLAARQRHEGPDLPTADDDGRYSSHDELRYSLRSVEYFAPWVRRIHVVTAGQIPTWLNTDDERINIVDHGEIFADPLNLPTFNSHAIESQLHRIPNLAEHFIYMNDDVFLGRSVSPGDFFTTVGQSRFFLSTNTIRAAGPGELPVDLAAKNNGAIMADRFGRTTTRKFLHAPHAQRRSTLERIEKDYPEAVSATAAAPFRSSTDLSIPSSLAHYYGLFLGNAVPASISSGYVDISSEKAQLQLLRMMRGTMPEVYCLNEVESRCGDELRIDHMVRHFLDHSYPVPSDFER